MEEKMISIVEKVSAMYMNYGIRSVTMDDVARELGISKKTLYQYFSDKNELVKQVITLHLRRLDEEFVRIAKMKMDAIDTMLHISDSINRFITEFNPNVNYDLMKYHPEVWQELLEYKRNRVFNNVRENILRGMREGLYRKDLDPDVIARLYVTRMRVVMDKDIVPMSSMGFSQFFKEIISYHIRGIASKKGIELFEKIAKDHKLFQE
jgi:AcrR family transcriptional regulator